MQKQIAKILIAAMLAGAVPACTKPSLPTPSVEYPTPPATLMEPARNMQTIPETK